MIADSAFSQFSSEPMYFSVLFGSRSESGKFPLWLSPDQVVVLPISEKFNDYAQKVTDYLNAHDIRAQIDDRNEKIGLLRLGHGPIPGFPPLLFRLQSVDRGFV